jgi:hypothetical protein
LAARVPLHYMSLPDIAQLPGNNFLGLRRGIPP